MGTITGFLGDSPGAIALLALGVALIVCGASACWCFFGKRDRDGRCTPARRW